MTSSQAGLPFKQPTFAAASAQGCQMVYFQTKDPNLGKFWRALQWKMLVYFMPIWYTLRPFDKFYSHLVYFMAIWYIWSRSGML
jgi:hypothetical protein